MPGIERVQSRCERCVQRPRSIPDPDYSESAAVNTLRRRYRGLHRLKSEVRTRPHGVHDPEPAVWQPGPDHHEASASLSKYRIKITRFLVKAAVPQDPMLGPIGQGVKA